MAIIWYFRTLQRFIYKGLYGIDFTFDCVDDICIASSGAKEHIERLSVVLRRLDSRGPNVEPGKCTFGVSNVDILGHNISENGIKSSEKKIRSIKH